MTLHHISKSPDTFRVEISTVGFLGEGKDKAKFFEKMFLTKDTKMKNSNQQGQFWRYGQIAKCARKAGISPMHFRSILERRRRVTPPLAARLSGATGIPAEQFEECRQATHPAFFGPRLPFTREFWRYGVLCATATKVGISQADLSNIIHRRLRVPPRLALKLARATNVPACEWATSRMSKHSAFYGAAFDTL